MLVLALGAAAASRFTIAGIVEAHASTSEEMHREVTVLTELRDALRVEEMMAHGFVEDSALLAEPFLGADATASQVLAEAAHVFDTGSEPALTQKIRERRDAIFGSLVDEARDPSTASFLGGPPSEKGGLHDVIARQSQELYAEIDTLQEHALAEIRGDLAAADGASRHQVVTDIAMLAGFLGLMMFFAGRLRRRVLGPIATLQSAAARIRDGDFDHRVDLRSEDEFGELAGAFNAMGEALEANQRRLQHQAFHDPLTNLGNRALLKDRLEHALARQARTDGLLAMVLLDLDDFKSVNDSLGHWAGDALLTEVAGRLRECTREADTVARLGGDEFAILFEDLADPHDAVRAAERIVAVLDAHFNFDGSAFPLSASLGIAFAEAGLATADDVVRNADVAMYITKSSHKGGYTVFEPGMHLAVKDRLQLKTDLAAAMSTDQLGLYYQPIVDLPGSAIVGVEALARWNHPTRGMVPPAEFIPLAEESGLIVPLGLWVLETACRQLQEWRRNGQVPPSLGISVNVSGRQLEDPNFVENVRQVFERLELDPGKVVLEITESVLVSKLQDTVVRLHELKRLGVRLAIDDFGTGYSSLGSLQDLPVDLLKVDKRFVDSLEGEDERGSLARAILGLGRTLRLHTIAEGVESEIQASQLTQLSCEMAQGYFFARPVPGTEIPALFGPPAPGKDARPGGTSSSASGARDADARAMSTVSGGQQS